MMNIDQCGERACMMTLRTAFELGKRSHHYMFNEHCSSLSDHQNMMMNNIGVKSGEEKDTDRWIR